MSNRLIKVLLLTDSDKNIVVKKRHNSSWNIIEKNKHNLELTEEPTTRGTVNITYEHHSFRKSPLQVYHCCARRSIFKNMWENASHKYISVWLLSVTNWLNTIMTAFAVVNTWEVFPLVLGLLKSKHVISMSRNIH